METGKPFHMSIRILFFTLCFLTVSLLYAQECPDIPAHAKKKEKKEKKELKKKKEHRKQFPLYNEVIEDNSFFIEEAYNQEEHVVQHIINGLWKNDPEDLLQTSFTQKWPLFKYKHQFSYTIPYTFHLDETDKNGFNNIIINYRYQLFYKEDWACVSPRLSYIHKTGDAAKGNGQESIGAQFNLPFSKRLSDKFIMHLNAGATYFNKVNGFDYIRKINVFKDLVSYNFGGSLIWLSAKRINIMLEDLSNRTCYINHQGEKDYSWEFIINPGIRYAINLKDIQIVPGLCVPVYLNKENSSVAAFFYLSFEHSF